MKKMNIDRLYVTGSLENLVEVYQYSMNKMLFREQPFIYHRKSKDEPYKLVLK